MVFPQTPLPVQIELQVGGVWTDITTDVYTEDRITIERGQPDEAQRTDHSRCSLVLNNRSGKFSPCNPLSPYFGLIGRNTPIRVSVLAGSQFLRLPGAAGDYAATPHTAALAITGDIDVRVDAQLENWLDASDALRTTEIIGKLAGLSGDKSWFLGVRNNRLFFEWSPDGSSTLSASSTVEPVIPPSGRLAIRATLDVDNGSGGRTVTFYTAPSGTAGPWTQLGAAVVQSGTTGIFNAAAAELRIGDATVVSMTRAAGRCLAAQVRSGIDGTVVANPVFTAQAIGATSFTDSVGRTWTLAGGTQITNRRTRFIGEVSNWPARWDVSGKDVRVPIEASGVLRRYGQGQKAFDSTLRRRIPAYNPAAYWPLEEPNGATQAYSPVPGVRPLSVSGVSFGADDTLGGATTVPAWDQDAEARGTIPVIPAGAWHVECVMRLDTMPSSLNTLLEVDTTGTAKRYTVRVQTNNVRVQALDGDGTELALINLSAPEFTGRWNRFVLWARQQGSVVEIHVAWLGVGTAGVAFSTTYTATEGRPTGVRVSGVPGNLRLGHLAVFSAVNTAAFNAADDGFAGERAGARLRRLASEEAKPIVVFGDQAVQEVMGPQKPMTFLDLVEETAQTDGGILYERRDILGLAYRDRHTLYNQPAALALDFNARGLAHPLEPADDDQQLRNDRTVQREGGSSARAVLEEGPLSIQAPPNGVGPYDDSTTVNLYSDGLLEQHAHWKLHLGTVNELRYPVVNLDLAAGPDLIDAATQLDCGDRLTIANPPAWLPPGTIDLIMRGQTEVIGHPADWDMSLNCTPASPWRVAVRDDAALARRDTAGSTLAAAATADATTLYVLTTAGLPWTTAPADMPLALTVGGEEITASVTSWLRDTFSRTVAGGWGTPDTGPAWAVVGGGAASDYAVQSGYGVQVLTTVDVSRRTAVTAVHADFDLYCDVTTSAAAAGDALFGGPTARMQDASTMYQARVGFNTGGSIVLSIRKLLAGANTAVGSVYTLPFSHVAGQFVRVRFQGRGGQLRAKAWAASAPEPSVWHVEGTDTAITAAHQIGTRSSRPATNTNAATVEVRYDNFEIVNPQTLAAVRSVNGVIKAQAAGQAVTLARPAVRAL
ncbi:hypothetical protein OQI_20365 [Streptomyces pharetrae CZA14]|uniref:CBM-cenC domain-containing protein n=1 Tax=Streptomyces pharetrae CZA14 TaxID=1144883 RepID=A0ABX3YHH1_9ACTN|nr:hypothetical protein OQI_20365 [Streptomyces pharetrae CZA14]